MRTNNMSLKLINNGIVPTHDLRTFDFHEMEGKPQTDQENEKIHNQIVNHPDQPMVPGGESFDEAAARALPIVEKLLQTKDVLAIVTHNSMYGLIKLWYENGRPKVLTKKFRSEYINQDNTNPTGSFICMEGDNGGEVYLIRHGETNDNEEGNFRRADAVLTERGRNQAMDIGNELSDEGIKMIYSSDLPRAMETARIIQSVNLTRPDGEKVYKLKTKPKMVTMPFDEFVKEHTHLIEVLKSGTQDERDAEAAEQQDELDEQLSGSKEEDE